MPAFLKCSGLQMEAHYSFSVVIQGRQQIHAGGLPGSLFDKE